MDIVSDTDSDSEEEMETDNNTSEEESEDYLSDVILHDSDDESLASTEIYSPDNEE